MRTTVLHLELSFQPASLSFAFSSLPIAFGQCSFYNNASVFVSDHERGTTLPESISVSATPGTMNFNWRSGARHGVINYPHDSCGPPRSPP